MILLKKINIEVEKIEVIKNWLKPKSVCNIQVFLGFANFYWQFIQSFSRILASLTSIMKTTESLNKLAFIKNNNSKSAFNRNDNNRSPSRKNNNNGEVNRYSISKSDIEHAKKSGKLSKSRKSKSEKMSKSWNLAKSGKKLLKNGNLTNFNIMGVELKFLISDARTTFNHLWLAFIKALILWHFDLECHI